MRGTTDCPISALCLAWLQPPCCPTSYPAVAALYLNSQHLIACTPPLQVRPGQGPRPEPSRCFSDAANDQIMAAVKEWEELSSAATNGVKQQPSLRAVALEHR
jgi:hypothetical protein